MPFRFNPFTHKLDIVDTQGGIGGALSSLTGNSGGAVFGDGAGNITLTGVGLTLIGNPATHSFVVGLNTPVSPGSGGTGVVNNSASTLTISGNFATTLTVTGTTGVTLPTSGTLATTAQLPSLPLSGANGGTGIANTGLSIDLTTGAAATKVLTSDSSGNGTWQSLPSPSFVGFSVTTNGTISAVTGDGTEVNAALPDVILDTNSGYNTGTGTYTIPVGLTGKWKFTSQLTGSGFDVTNTSSYMIFRGSLVVFSSQINPSVISESGILALYSATAIYQLSAGDTITCNLSVSGSASKNVSLVGGLGQCYFTGEYLGP